MHCLAFEQTFPIQAPILTNVAVIKNFRIYEKNLRQASTFIGSRKGFFKLFNLLWSLKGLVTSHKHYLVKNKVTNVTRMRPWILARSELRTKDQIRHCYILKLRHIYFIF
jgi:hypothetical protein